MNFSFKLTSSGIIQGLCIVLVFAFFVFLGFPTSIQAQSADQLFSQAVNQYVNGEDRQALGLLERALEVDPNHDNALQLRQQIQEDMPDDVTSPVQREEPSPTPDSENQNGAPPEQSTTDNGQSPSEPSDQETMDAEDSEQALETESFRPVPEGQRSEKSPSAPDLSETPIDTVKHINNNYSVDARRTEAVYGIEAQQFKDRVRYLIHSSGTVDVITSRIFQPPMIIVDIPNTVDRLPSSPLPIGFENHLRVRHSQYRIEPMNVTRVVIDLDQWNENYRIYRAPPGDRIVVDVFESSAEMDSTEREGDLVSEPDQASDDRQKYSDREKDRGPDVRFERVGGNDQTLQPTEKASEPLAVSLTNDEGDPLSGVNVIYEVVQGKGKIDADPDEPGNQSRIHTDDKGFARARFVASEKAGPMVVEAFVPEHNLVVRFQIMVEPGEPAAIEKITGDKQETMFGRPVETPPEIRVVDRYGNPVPGVRVEFEDLSQEGFIDVDINEEGIQRSSRTDANGRLALDLYRIPSNRSTNQLQASVHRPDREDLTTRFTIYGHAQLLSIDFKEANLQDVLRTLSEIAQWNIVQAEQVQGRPISEMTVSVHLRDVTAIRALDTILDVKGLSRVSDGNVMKIVPKAQAIRKGVPVLSPGELQEYQGNNMVTVTYQLTYLTANGQLANTLQQALLAENSSIVPDENSNSITITDLANNQRKIYKILNQIDRPNEKFQVKVIELEYKDAEQFQSQLTNLLPLGQQANISHNPRSNALMVYGEATLIERIELLVDALDRPGQLQENYSFVDMTGFDEEQIANQVNAILGLQVIPLQEISSLSFDFDDPEDAVDFIESARQMDMNQLLQSANIIPMPRLNKILIFGPMDIQEAAMDIISRLKESQEGYIESRQYEWYQPKTMPMEKLVDMVGNIGNLQIETDIPEFDAVLLASPTKENLRRGIEFLNKIDRADLGSYAFEVVKIERGDPDRILSKVNEILGKQSLSQQQESIFVIGPGDDLPQQAGTSLDEILDQLNIITFESANSIILVGPSNFRNFVKQLIRQVESSIEEIADFRWMWYRPKALPIERLVSMLERTRFGQVEAALIEQNLILIRSDNEKDFERLTEMLGRLDPSDLEPGREIISYTPQFIDGAELADDVQTYFEDLQSAQESQADGGGSGEPIPRVLHAGEERVIFVVNEVDAATIRKLIDQLDKNFYEDQTIMTYVPDHVSPETLEEEISEMGIGRLVYVDETRISMLVPTNRKREFRRMFREIDSSGHTTNVIYLKHTRAEQLLPSLQTIQGNMDLNVNFAADQATNSIIYSAPRTAKTDVEALVTKLDRWQKQVFIEGIILEYTLSEGNEFRYQWFLNPSGNQVPNADRVPSGDAGAQFGNLDQFGGSVEGTFAAILNKQDFQSVLSVLANESQSEVLAKPQITAINNQQASIRVGDEQQIQVQRQTEEGVVSSLQAVEAFTELQVTPTITSNRHVLMDILISSDQFTTPNAANVQTQTTRRQTQNSVLVQDGQTVVIGGLIEEDSNDNESGIPYLMDVPFAGNLFKSSEQTTSKRELVIFLTPHVVENPAESRRQSQRVSDSLQQITPLAININIARQAQLARIQGLSPRGEDAERRQLARQIVLHRETFGPYRNFSELLEVPGMTEDILNNIIYRIDYRIDLNTVSIDDLIMIKNINHGMAQSVIEQRQQVGTFESLAPVKQILLDHGLSESYYRTFLQPVLYVAGVNSSGQNQDQPNASDTDNQSEQPGIRSGPSPSEAGRSPSLPSLEDL